MKKLITSLFLVGLLAVFSGCEKELEVAAKPKIDISLPVVESSSIKTMQDFTSIALEWKSIDAAQAQGYLIYRSDMQKDGQSFKRVATIKNKYATHHLDKGLEMGHKYSYSVSLLGINGIESNPSSPVTVSTKPHFKSVSLIDTISNLPRQIKVLWRPHTNARVAKYIIQRSTPTTAKWEELTVVKDRYNVEYIDEKLGDNEIYLYRIKAETFDGIVSTPSVLSSATTKPLPGQIKALEATRDIPRKIQLSWGASKTKDVVSHNIYRASSVDGTFNKISHALAEHNGFDDLINEDGKIYFYKITTVDKDSLESKIDELSPTMGSTLSKPRMPQITLAQIQGNKIILNWESSDDRTVSFNIFKSSKEGWKSSEKVMIANTKELRFEDPDVVRGVEYRYSIQSVDQHGLVSKQTEELSSMLPKLEQKAE